jgi:molecular chaperone GrpE
MALKHSAEKNTDSQSLIQGVENTLRELTRTLEKFGLTAIEALGKHFDPAYYHAMSQVEREDLEDNIVVEEFRKGYLYRDKVLRPSLVAVSKKTSNLVNG